MVSWQALLVLVVLPVVLLSSPDRQDAPVLLPNLLRFKIYTGN
jgi:hypothetical protein